MRVSDTQFDYYYGSEGDQFSFIRIPKLMLLDPKFQALSLKSIILYGFLLDRMNLSMRRGWLDEDNRVYIRFRIKEIMEDMNVCEKTAIGYLAELEKIGLVEKDKKGMGMGNKLYVKNFISPDLRSKAFITSKKYSNGETESTSKNRNPAENVDNFENSEVCKASKINITVENGGNETVDFYGDEAVENDGYDAVSFSGDDTVKSYSQSNTDLCNTEYINNKNINNININNGCDNLSNPIYRQNEGFFLIYRNKAKRFVGDNLIDTMDISNIYRTGLRVQFEYENLRFDYQRDREMVDELIEIMVEMLMNPNPKQIISGIEYTAEMIKGRILHMNSSHMEYMITCLKNNQSKVGNIKGYLRATVFNASVTIDNYYQAEVNYDLSHPIPPKSNSRTYDFEALEREVLAN